jgi:hypothetical protein
MKTLLLTSTMLVLIISAGCDIYSTTTLQPSNKSKLSGNIGYTDVILQNDGFSAKLVHMNPKYDGVIVSSSNDNDNHIWSITANDEVTGSIISSISWYQEEDKIRFLVDNKIYSLHLNPTNHVDSLLFIKQKEILSAYTNDLNVLIRTYEDVGRKSQNSHKIDPSPLSCDQPKEINLPDDPLYVTVYGWTQSQGCYYATDELNIECSNSLCIGCQEIIGCDCVCGFQDYFCACTARGFACIKE